MGDLLGALMGGATGQQSSSGDQGAGDMAGLLGALMGGATGQQSTGGGQGSGGMGNLLGALMGGGGASAGAGAFLTPLVTSLADKLGLPPEVAQMVVSFAIDKLFAGARGGTMSASRSGGDALDSQDLNELLVQMNSGKGVDNDLLESTGMTAELAEQTGLDPDTAAASLQEVFGMLGGQQ
jgi:hypothetical protein